MRNGNRSLGDVHRLDRPARAGLKRKVSFRRALFVSVGLSLLFLFVYGGCLWITARRGDVGVFYFEWERAIPFVPFMILPYLSIDLFFILAPFLFPNEYELRLYTRRVTIAILLAGIGFLLWPLRFAFSRPHVEGWLGAAFDLFRRLDAPNNLFPSLHAALFLLLSDAYARHTRGPARLAVLGWFVLIGLSPLLTHQHHVIDVLGGFALAGLCFLGVRPRFASPPPTKATHHESSLP